MVREEVHAARNNTTMVGVLGISDSKRTKKSQFLRRVVALLLAVICLGGLYRSSKLISVYQPNTFVDSKTDDKDDSLGEIVLSATKNVTEHNPSSTQNIGIQKLVHRPPSKTSSDVTTPKADVSVSNPYLQQMLERKLIRSYIHQAKPFEQKDALSTFFLNGRGFW
jgi:hypothetical protein